MKIATVERAADFTGVANAGATISTTGAERGYRISVGGYNQAYNLNLRANAANFEGAVRAAGQVRDAAIEAARLRAVASVIGSVGYNIARDMAGGMALQYQAIQDGAASKQKALGEYNRATIENQGRATVRFDQAQDLYRERMKVATIERSGALTGAANAGAAISSAGARSGYGLTVGGYNQAYNLNLWGNRINYQGAVNAAAQVRDASVEAARLRAVASVVSSVGHNIARDMEQGLTLRY